MSHRCSGAAKRPTFTPLGAADPGAFDPGAFGLALYRLALCCVALWCLGITPAVGHEGHDHAQPVVTSTAPTLRPGLPRPGLPRLAASSEIYELVATLEGGRLTIYLDRFEDDSPVADADITVTVNEEPVAATPSGSGTYTLSSNKFSNGGLVELVFDIRAKGGDDLLIGKLKLPVFPSGATSLDAIHPVAAPLAATPQGAISPDSLSWYWRAWSSARHGAEDHLIMVVVVLLAGLALGRGLRRRRFGKLLILVLAVPALVPTALNRGALAHEGDHGVESNAAATGDAARRLPNGHVFVPKPTQRILDVRTVIARSETHPKAAVFIGRVITDPNRSGIVQSITGGRVIAPEHGLPRLGQAVVKGDVVALVEPPMPIADRTTISERAGELEQSIAVAEAKLKRLRPLAERSIIQQSLVIETEAELAGLHRRRDLIRETRVAPEALRAPVDGVLALSRVVAGQVVQAQDLLFQIVDPNSLWVEAYDYGDNDPASLKGATAVGPANAAMTLLFQGWSRTLQQQATVLHFSITSPPPALRVGQPLTITAPLGDTVSGIIVDRDAVVRGGNGESIVWRHVEPELFEARPVRTEPFDAARVRIVSGVGAGERVVVRGAELINQIR
jgi:membrane fusion protein, heavy metal efflux system